MDEARRILSRAYGDADGFRRYWAPELGAAGAQLIAPLAIRDASRVLDLGAGIGVNVPTLHEAAPSAAVVAADYTEAMIRAAPASAARVCMDAGALGFGDGTFDAVVMAFMLFHVPDPSRALAEVRRVMRPGGRLAVGTWFAGDEDFEPDEVWYAELSARGAAAAPATIARHAMMDTPEKLADLVTNAGFDSIETGTGEFPDSMSGVEEFLTRRSTLGTSAARFETLSPDARASCLAAVRSKLARLEPDAFTVRDRAIFAWAVRAN